jgi:hypothetical protein
VIRFQVFFCMQNRKQNFHPNHLQPAFFYNSMGYIRFHFTVRLYVYAWFVKIFKLNQNNYFPVNTYILHVMFKNWAFSYNFFFSLRNSLFVIQKPVLKDVTFFQRMIFKNSLKIKQSPNQKKRKTPKLLIEKCKKDNS